MIRGPMPPRWQASLLNVAGFQLGWFGCVLMGAWAGGAIALAVIVAHLRWLAKPGEWRWLLGFLLAGVVIDGSLAALGGYRFDPQNPSLGPLALWLLWLWPLFATLIHHSLEWLWARPWLAALGGLIGGPSSYLGGAALAGVELADWLLPTQALIWASLCLVIGIGLRRRSG